MGGVSNSAAGMPATAGRAFKYGDDIDTDRIIPARYLNTFDPVELAGHCMEDEDPTFASRVRPGDVIVAGKNFGCGSSREHAPIAIKAAGVGAVIAGSFARIFFRNAINTGLAILESAEAAQGIRAGDEVRVDLLTGRIENRTRGESYQARPWPDSVRQIVAAGGLIPYVRRRLAGGGEAR